MTINIYPGVIKDKDTGEVIGELIPCRCKENGDDGIYNTYEKKFYRKDEIIKRLGEIIQNSGTIEIGF